MQYIVATQYDLDAPREQRPVACAAVDAGYCKPLDILAYRPSGNLDLAAALACYYGEDAAELTRGRMIALDVDLPDNDAERYADQLCAVALNLKHHLPHAHTGIFNAARRPSAMSWLTPLCTIQPLTTMLVPSFRNVPGESARLRGVAAKLAAAAHDEGGRSNQLVLLLPMRGWTAAAMKHALEECLAGAGVVEQKIAGVGWLWPRPPIDFDPNVTLTNLLNDADALLDGSTP